MVACRLEREAAGLLSLAVSTRSRVRSEGDGRRMRTSRLRLVHWPQVPPSASFNNCDIWRPPAPLAEHPAALVFAVIRTLRRVTAGGSGVRCGHRECPCRRRGRVPTLPGATTARDYAQDDEVEHGAPPAVSGAQGPADQAAARVCENRGAVLENANRYCNQAVPTTGLRSRRGRE
jgi:hypothetical protein